MCVLSDTSHEYGRSPCHFKDYVSKWKRYCIPFVKKAVCWGLFIRIWSRYPGNNVGQKDPQSFHNKYMSKGRSIFVYVFLKSEQCSDFRWPTHPPRNQNNSGKKYVHLNIPFMTSIECTNIIDFQGVFDHITFDKYQILGGKKNTWTKNMFSGVRIYFFFRNANSQFLVTHPPT